MADRTPVSDVLAALDFASVRHRDQRRKGPGREPYVNHLIEVAALLSRIAEVEDVALLSAAVLHDILEDTETTPAELTERFGPRVLELVQAVTDDKALSRSERKARILEHLQTARPEVKLIKLADLCSNISSIPNDWPAERRNAYFDWADHAARLCSGVCPALDAEYESRAKASRTGD